VQYPCLGRLCQLPLSTHISARLLELSQARAVHRFVIEDEETLEPQLLVRRSVFPKLAGLLWVGPCSYFDS
jgi:hypothetical protein